MERWTISPRHLWVYFFWKIHGCSMQVAADSGKRRRFACLMLTQHNKNSKINNRQHNCVTWCCFIKSLFDLFFVLSHFSTRSLFTTTSVWTEIILNYKYIFFSTERSVSNNNCPTQHPFHFWEHCFALSTNAHACLRCVSFSTV